MEKADRRLTGRVIDHWGTFAFMKVFTLQSLPTCIIKIILKHYITIVTPMWKGK